VKGAYGLVQLASLHWASDPRLVHLETCEYDGYL